MEPQKTMTEQELQDEQLIQQAFQRLLDTYLASNHRKKSDIITKAFNFAKAAHKGVRRRSGEPYILHPISVAQIISEEIGMGSTSICAALLHDVVEDTDYTREDIANLFGEKVANIVEGVTKVSSGLLNNQASMQAETFKKILLTMSDDIRVILVKIADRLHNMRTLSSMLPAKQYKIVGETLSIFAPIADRLGLNRIKTELEDLSFKYEHPEDYQAMLDNLKRSEMERDDAIKDFTPPICAALDAMGVDYELKARIKSPYSIWQKMQRKHIPFEEVFDILAIRIVFRPTNRENEIAECYKIYGQLTQIYSPHPSRLRDWLSTPKANGYQALHNTFMSKRGKWIEVQIRSDRMDDVAEGGFAAHWKYKEPGAAYDEHELDKWLNSIKEILDDPQPDTLVLLDTIKLNLCTTEINIFTPKGDIITLPRGATVLDFAYAVHTMVGSHCMGAKVNHKLAAVNHRLSNGDQVEVLTAQTQMVKPEWEKYVITGKASGKIAIALRREAREAQREGEERVKTFLKSHDMEVSMVNIQKLQELHGFKDAAALYKAVGEGELDLGDIDVGALVGQLSGKKGWRRFLPFLKGKENKVAVATVSDGDREAWVRSINRKATLILTEELLDKCVCCPDCRPINGDEVMGYITPEATLEIHRRDCPTALRHKTSFGNNIVAAKWETGQPRLRSYPTTIQLEGVDARGVIRAVSDALDEWLDVKLTNIHLSAHNGIFTGTLELHVFSTEDVRRICNRLKAIPEVSRAFRPNPSAGRMHG